MCDQVSGGSDPESVEYSYTLAHQREVDGPEAVSRDVRKSVSCRERIVRLKEAVFGTQSPAGACRIAQDGGASCVELHGAYAGCPITVEVTGRDAQPTRPGGGRNPNVAVVSRGGRRVLKAAIVAAAVIPLAILFHHTHGSSGITLAKVVRAFGQARNVRVVSLDPQNGQVIYELWVARELGLTGIMTSQGCVVYDLTRGEKQDVVSGAVTRMKDLELANVREMGDRCLGFTLAGLPADAKWTRTNGGPNREIYEFAWTGQTGYGRDLPIRYEVTIDTSTMLPTSLRLFRMETPDMGWEWQSLIVFEYLTEARMRSVMRGESLAGAGDSR